MHIDELCNLFGVSRRTIHYYARKGLLIPPPQRGGYVRTWPPENVQRIRTIREAKDQTITLSDMAENPQKYFGRV